VVECGGLEMFAANLNKSSQVSVRHAKSNNQYLSPPNVSYSVRKSVRKPVFLTGSVSRPNGLLGNQDLVRPTCHFSRKPIPGGLGHWPLTCEVNDARSRMFE
jgi:hypothetical protein